MKIAAITNRPDRASADIYWMPDSCMQPARKPLFVPDFDTDVRLFPSVVVRIDRLGKGVSPKFASRYYAECTLGFAARADGLYKKLSAKGVPVSAALCFDASAVIGTFFSFETLESLGPGIDISKNGERVCTCPLAGIRQTADDAVALASANNTLKTGDLIFVDLQGDGIPIAENDRLEVDLPETARYSLRIK